jgi:hypothetical protein
MIEAKQKGELVAPEHPRLAPVIDLMEPCRRAWRRRNRRPVSAERPPKKRRCASAEGRAARCYSSSPSVRLVPLRHPTRGRPAIVVEPGVL